MAANSFRWLAAGHVDWSGDDDLFPVDFGDEWEFGDLIEPIVLDLDGDGVDIVAREDSPVYFNVDGDAALEKTAWAGRNDALLVIDLAAGATVWHSRHGRACPQPLRRAA
jgi:hypothetical protein